MAGILCVQDCSGHSCRSLARRQATDVLPNRRSDCSTMPPRDDQQASCRRRQTAAATRGCESRAPEGLAGSPTRALRVNPEHHPYARRFDRAGPCPADALVACARLVRLRAGGARVHGRRSDERVEQRIGVSRRESRVVGPDGGRVGARRRLYLGGVARRGRVDGCSGPPWSRGHGPRSQVSNG